MHVKSYGTYRPTCGGGDGGVGCGHGGDDAITPKPMTQGLENTNSGQHDAITPKPMTQGLENTNSLTMDAER